MPRVVNSIMRYLLSIILLSNIFSQSDCVDNRYIDDIFNVIMINEVEYGENTNQSFIDSDYTQTLYMDIYQPDEDNFEDRPLIIFMFGGAFIGGSKESGDIVDLCTNFAKKGYVAAAIDYRLTTNLILNPSEEKAYEAVIKAIQDLRASIRYFRMNDALYDDYKIDSNRIYVGGISAGAIASLNSVYMDTEEEALMLVTSEHLEELGGFEGESGNPGYASDAHGVVNLCGAIGSLDWIGQPDKPIVSMHGDQDGTVPYSDESVTLFGLDVQVYGSYSINETMNELGNYSSLHTYVGQDHVPFTSNMNFETDFITNFFYDVVCGNNDFSTGDINEDSEVNILDVIMLINLVLSDEYISSGDLNEDSYLNILDIVQLVNTILND